MNKNLTNMINIINFQQNKQKMKLNQKMKWTQKKQYGKYLDLVKLLIIF